MIAELKTRLRDVPGIETLTRQLIGGRQVFGFNNGLIAAVDPSASDEEIERAIRVTAERKARYDALPKVSPVQPGVPKMSSPGGFAASIRAMMDEARAGLEKSKADGLAKVGDAVGKLNEAKVATAKVAGVMAKTIEDEAAAVLSELGQISNDLGTE